MFNTLGPRQDDHHLHIISKSIFWNEVYTFWLKSLQFVPKGTVDYKSKLVPAMVWRQAYTKPLPESEMIQVHGAYMRLSDSLGCFTVLGNRAGKYIAMKCGEHGTVGAHEGCLHRYPSAESGQFRTVRSGRGWPYFVKSSMTVCVHMQLGPVWLGAFCLLLLISMLWHRQAIFESKGDKLSSFAECCPQWCLFLLISGSCSGTGKFESKGDMLPWWRFGISEIDFSISEIKQIIRYRKIY